jgi:hypothetical protein
VARPRRAVIRAAVAQNRPAQPRLSVSQNRRASGNIGVSRGRPARASAGYKGGAGAGGQGAGAQGSNGLPQASNAMPWDSSATDQVNVAGMSYGNAIAAIGANEDFTRRNIGLGAGYENNPYSQASLLQRQREIGNRGANQRPGQLYSGATVNHLGQVERGYNEGQYGLQQQLAADEAKWGAQRNEAQQIRQEKELAAQEAAIQRAAEVAPEPVPVGPAPSGGGGGNKSKNKKGGGGGFKRNKGIG